MSFASAPSQLPRRKSIRDGQTHTTRYATHIRLYYTRLTFHQFSQGGGLQRSTFPEKESETVKVSRIRALCVSGINIQIPNARLKQEEGPCSGKFHKKSQQSQPGYTLNVWLLGRSPDSIVVFAGLFTRADCPHDQTRLCKGRPRTVFCFFDRSTEVTLSVRDRLFLLPSLSPSTTSHPPSSLPTLRQANSLN